MASMSLEIQVDRAVMVAADLTPSETLIKRNQHPKTMPT
jgi:hypothetical protein